MSMFDSGQAFPSRATCKRMDDGLLGIVEKRGMEAIKAMVAERLERLPSGYAPDPHAGQPPGPELSEAAVANGG